MPQYKAFSSATCGDDLARLEHAINHWMESEQPRIYLTTQSPFGSHLVVSFLYDLSDVADTGMTAVTAVPEVFERTMEDTELDPEEHEPAQLPEAELPY